MVPENKLSKEAKNELDKLKKMLNSEGLVYRRNEYTYSFKCFRAINTFCRDIDNSTLKEADKDQSSLLIKVTNFKSKMKPQNQQNYILKNLYAIFDSRDIKYIVEKKIYS